VEKGKEKGEGKIKRGMRSERRRGENFANFSNLSLATIKLQRLLLPSSL
jgi:hypothetical protein